MARGDATVRRSLLRDRDVMIAAGDFGDLFRAWYEHATRWQLERDGLGEVMMRQALAGAALQLGFRVPEESTAWTLSIHTPPANVFVTGGGAHHDLTGRYYSSGVAEHEFSRLFVQRAHHGREAQHSVVEVEGLDVLLIYEQFFRGSEQTAARLVELEADRFAMVLALPDADRDWVEGLDAATIGRLEGEGQTLDTRRYRFHCGCNANRVAGTLARMFADQADEFFRGEPVVEALCPRCGARHLLDRKTFDRVVEGL